MSHHASGPEFGFPRGDARLDMTDLYAFPKPGDPGKSILVLNVHPSVGGNPPGPTTNSKSTRTTMPSPTSPTTAKSSSRQHPVSVGREAVATTAGDCAATHSFSMQTGSSTKCSSLETIPSPTRTCA